MKRNLTGTMVLGPGSALLRRLSGMTTAVRGPATMDQEASPRRDDEGALLVALSARYCWDSEPSAALTEAERVILRTMDVGTWEDCLDIERIFGRARLVDTLQGARAGALTPRSWHFWHYRLGLADADTPPPPIPMRRIG